LIAGPEGEEEATAAVVVEEVQDADEGWLEEQEVLTRKRVRV